MWCSVFTQFTHYMESHLLLFQFGVNQYESMITSVSEPVLLGLTIGWLFRSISHTHLGLRDKSDWANNEPYSLLPISPIMPAYLGLARCVRISFNFVVNVIDKDRGFYTVFNFCKFLTRNEIFLKYGLLASLISCVHIASMTYYKLLPLETFYFFLGLLIPRTVLRVAYLYKIIWLVSKKISIIIYMGKTW